MPQVADLWITLRALTAPFTAALAAAGAEAERATVQLRALQTEAAAASTRMTRLATRTDAAATALVRLSTESGTANAGLAGSSAESLRAAELFATLETAITATGERLAALGVSSDAAATGLAATGVEARGAATALSTTATAAGEAGVAIEGASAKATGLGATLGKASLLGTVALAAVGVESVRMASSFQAEMAKINTQAMVSKDQIQPLSNAVLNLAGQVGFSPTSLAEALFHVESSFASTGITGEKALEILKVGAEGAAVGHSDLVETVNAMDAAIAAGIPGVNNFTESMGALNAIVGSGDMSMQDLTKAFSTGGLAVVTGYGLRIQDVGAALATFGDNNMRGAASMTNLRMAVQAFAVPAKSAGALLERFGMTSETLANDMQRGGLKLAIDDLNERFRKAGVTATEQGQIITEMFGKKAGTGIAVLLNQYDRTISKYPELAKGATEFGDAWTTTSQTLSQQLKSIGAGFDAVMIRVGTFLIPYVSRSITAIESVGKRAVKDLVDLWDIYGPAVEQKLGTAAAAVEAGAKRLLVPLRSEILHLADTTLPIANKAFDKLKAKLDEVRSSAQPVVNGLQAMYKSAVSSGGALETLKDRLKLGAEALGGVGLGLSTTTTLLRPLGQLVGGLAHAFADLSGPMQLSVLWMLAMRPFRPQIQSMQLAVTEFGRSALGSFRGIAGAMETQRVLAERSGISLGRFGQAFAAVESRVPVISAMATSFRNTSASIEQAGGRLVGFRSTVGGLATALGTGAGAGLMGAMKGLWSFMGGGWGVAITGAMMGLDMLAKRQQQAAAAAEAHRQRISSLASALKESNGALTASVRATVVQTLADAKLKDGKTSLLDTMHKVGIDATTLTNAYMGQGTSIDSLRQKLLAAAEQNKVWVASGKGSVQVYSAQGQALKAAADAIGPLNGEMATSTSRAKELADAVNADSAAAQLATTPVGQLKTLIHTLADSEASADDKANALHQSLKLLSGGTLDVQAAIALQNSAIIELNHTWQDGVDGAKGYGSALLTTSGSLNTATENGQTLFSKLTSLRDQTADAAKATYDYAHASGASLPDALKQAEDAMQKSWEAAVTAGEEMGLTKDQAEQLAAQMGLIPSNLAITIGLNDLTPIKASMQYVLGLAGHLKEGAVVKVGALTSEAIAELEKVGVKTKSLPGGTVEITVPDAEVWRKLRDIEDERIPDKYFHIVPLGPGAGQSHDIGYADGGLVRRFADGGVLRAADGMTVPGYAPRQDTVLSLLSPGEGVLVPEAVRAIGGERAITSINRTARSTNGLSVGTATLAARSGGGGGTTVIYHTDVHVHGSVLAEHELRDLVQEQMLRQGMNNPQTWPSFARK